jgi:Domain of unknown function (DUF4167)
MRQQPSGRRPRGRSNRKHFVPHRSQTFDSHGPDVRVRGNAMQVYEKYVNLARDAASSGDRIVAESYQQYAEHYYRIINDTTDPQRPVSERPDADRDDPERPEADRGMPERTGAQRQSGGGQPYPVDAEQPFVDGGTAASASGGNGQASEAKPERASAGERAAGDGAPESPPADQTPADQTSADQMSADQMSAEPTKAKPRGRGRPRARAKAGNGAADDADVDGVGTSPSSESSEAGESTN